MKTTESNPMSKLSACTASALFSLLCITGVAHSADEPSTAAGAKPVETKSSTKISFKRFELDDKFRSEGVAYGDFNKDGKTDIAAGSVWFEAPEWKMRSILDKPKEFNPLGYSDTFCNFTSDVNGDGWIDLLVVDFPGKQTWWFENPKETGKPWPRHECTKVTNNESPTFWDIDGDGKRELVFGTSPDPKNSDSPERRMSFFKPAMDPVELWKEYPISAAGAPSTTKFSHGLGLGDINGDKRTDVLVPQGWWEAPENPESGKWTFHNAPFGPACAQMYVYDFNKDGLNDVVTSSAHDIGVWWYEQTKEGWKSHEISKDFSQSHGLCMADINGDGLPDLITGKRWWAHGPKGDKNPGDPAVLVWFELSHENGQPVWTPHYIDHNSGVGTQFEVADINGDKLLDVIVSNKKGTFYFQQTRE